ncbi:MAG: YYY membrane protein [Candidatus Woesebacteria bacterium GW2011_GWA1_45_8]|uniref:YYY membrane protein n=1 Tax=Candidatus Woesebacteria bacterium GW2011_GWA1_45_8 TaxID=1618559 RepID=A0A0G1MVS0_9BACT|nr:MAG: YYY membrane protein [Candidatus Woesebacteria bacterium GW2011_GWA1_45_8]
MGEDISFVYVWWTAFFVIGFSFFPLSRLLFKKFSDSGWAVGKILGIAALTFFFFVFSSLKAVPITRLSIVSALGGFSLLGLTIFLRFKKDILLDLSSKKIPIIISEILFILGLFGWSYVRGHQPDIRGLEKFMDFGFINSILRGEFLPPADMWYAGSPMNYYWFGHLTTALLTKLTSIPSDISYNLMLGAILGIGLSCAFSIVSSLFEKFGKRAAVAGILSAFLLTMGGNFHTPYFALKDGYEKYWYPDATRFIGYNPDTNDKTIHEFPSYSFIVSDLHAHLLDFPFVLLFLALLLTQIKYGNKKGLISMPLVLMGVVLGIMFSTSTWDFGIYLIVASITFLMSTLSEESFSLKTLLGAAAPTVMVGAVGLISALPFILNFDSIAQGISLVNTKTPLWQLLILWGFPLLISAVFFIGLAKTREISKTQGFILSILIASWILIAMPEIFYVKDIYSGSHQRANTMFKLTYQAFVMFYISSGYIIVTALGAIKKNHFRLPATIVSSVVISSLLIYPYFGLKAYYGELKSYKGLGGIKWLSSAFPGEYQAVAWFNQNVKGQPVILEAPGDSYTDYNVISSYTGLPTVSGWFVHQWLWRGSAEIPQARVTDISAIYLSKDPLEAKRLLNKYDVEYVIVGNFEREKFPGLNEEKFTKLGKQVFVSEGTKIYRIMP